MCYKHITSRDFVAVCAGCRHGPYRPHNFLIRGLIADPLHTISCRGRILLLLFSGDDFILIFLITAL